MFKNNPTRGLGRGRAAEATLETVRDCGGILDGATVEITLDLPWPVGKTLVSSEMIDRVTQQYVYHRLMTELRDRSVTVVDEQVAEDRTVKIRVRNW